MDKYLEAEANGTSLSKEQIRSLWKSAKAEGKREGKARENDIRADDL